MREDMKVTLGVVLPLSLSKRIEACLDSPVSGIRSKREFVETAITKYLDSVEPIIAKLEKELLIIKGSFRDD